MTNSSSLINKHCFLYQNGSTPLKKKEINSFLEELHDKWQINELGHLYKHYEFSNFIEGIEFANQITLIAEKEGHHPNLIISWGVCTVEIWTHKINGLTESDFILAAKIENIKKI